MSGRAHKRVRSLRSAPPLLPIQLDDSELPGLRPTVGYVDARHTSVERLVWLIEQKLSTRPGVITSEPPVLRSPRTTEQQRELLALRPRAWEYLLYGGMLWQHRQALESKWRDHELGYARRTRQHLDDQQAVTFVGNALNDLESCGPNMLKMLDPRAQERAFGPPGQPGDPALIEHLATRFIEVYEEMLDVAATLRGVGVSAEMAPLMEAVARLTDTPLREIRDFIDQLVAEVDRLPERLELNKPITMTLMLTLTVDKEALNYLDKELARARRKLRI